MTTYQILYWHDIPLQVRAGGRGDRVSVPLPARFQEAVDQAAMAAGHTGDDVYTAGLRWSTLTEGDGDPRSLAERVAAELAAAIPRIDWRATVAALEEERGEP